MIGNPSEQHDHIRLCLNVLLNLHNRGYTTLRFMLLSEGNLHKFYFGAKRIFSIDDGMFIPEDIRHRAICLDSREVPPDSETLIEVLRKAVEQHNVPGSFPTYIQGIDRDYSDWLRSLVTFLDKFDYAIPRRFKDEFLNPHCKGLAIEFKQASDGCEIAPTIYFKAPSPGSLNVSKYQEIIDPKIICAQPRDNNAPSLVWPNINKKNFDKEIDENFEINSRSND